MTESSKEELLQLIKRFGAYLTVKMSSIFPISLHNLVLTSFSSFFSYLVKISDGSECHLSIILNCLMGLSFYVPILFVHLICVQLGSYLNVNLFRMLVFLRKFDA